MQTGQRLDGDALLRRDVDDPLARLARGGRDRDQELVGPAVVDDVRQLVGRAEHPDPVQAQVLLARVVVDQADRGVAERRCAQHLLQHQLRGVARPDEDHLLAARDDRAALRPLDDRAREHARAGDERQGQQAVDRPDRPRHFGRVQVEEAEGEERDERRGDDAARGAPHVARRDVAPPAVVEAEEGEDRELEHRHDPEQAPGDVVLVVAREAGVEAEAEGEEPGGDHDRRVGCDLRQAVPVDRRPHAREATPTTERITSTTRSCCSAVMPAQSGTEKFSAAARSVSGRAPSS